MGRMKEYYHEEINREAEDYEYQHEQYQREEKERDKLIHNNLPLAIHIANQYNWSSVDIEDLVQEAREGLVRAADEYMKSGSDVPFSYVAGSKIKNRLRRLITKSRIVNISPSYVSKASAIDNMREQMFKKQGYYDDEKIKEYYRYKDDTFARIIQAVHSKEGSPEDYDFKDNDDVLDEEYERYKQVKKAIKEKLTDRQFEVYILRHEFDMSSKEIASLLGISTTLVWSALTTAQKHIDSIVNQLNDNL